MKKNCIIKDCPNDAVETNIVLFMFEGHEFEITVCDHHADILRRGTVTKLSIAKDLSVVPSPARPAERSVGSKTKDERPERYGSNDANGWREGPAEWDYMHRYDSPDNERDTMG